MRHIIGKIRSSIRIFIRDWQEMQEAMRPMEDPTASKVQGKRDLSIWQIPNKSKILKETFQLYILTLTNREAAVKEIERDEEIIRMRDKKRGESTSTENVIDMSMIAKEVDDLIMKKEELKLKDAILNIYDRKDELKDLLADRLLIFSEATTVMMEGYKNGKEVGLSEAQSGDDFVSTGLKEILDETDPKKSSPSHVEEGKIVDKKDDTK